MISVDARPACTCRNSSRRLASARFVTRAVLSRSAEPQISCHPYANQQASPDLPELRDPQRRDHRSGQLNLSVRCRCRIVARDVHVVCAIRDVAEKAVSRHTTLVTTEAVRTRWRL